MSLTLFVLFAGSNFLTGSLPWRVQVLGKLERVELYDNLLAGQIPRFTHNPGSIKYVDLVSYFRFRRYENYAHFSHFLASEVLQPKPRRRPGNFLYQLSNIDHSSLLYVIFGAPCFIKSASSTDYTLFVLVPAVEEVGITGNFPASISSYTNLEVLHLETLGLMGTLRTEIGGLSSLRRLRLQDCNFAGTIPTQIGSLPKLERLGLSENELLSGTIPSFLNSPLEELDLVSSCNRAL